MSTWTSGGSIGETLSVWTPSRSGCYKVIIYGGGELGTGRYGAELESFSPSTLTVTESSGTRTATVASLTIQVALTGITLISNQTHRRYVWTFGFVALFR